MTLNGLKSIAHNADFSSHGQYGVFRGCTVETKTKKNRFSKLEIMKEIKSIARNRHFRLKIKRKTKLVFNADKNKPQTKAKKKKKVGAAPRSVW